MQNYIFNNGIIAVIKSNKKTIIIDVDNIKVINKNIRFVISINCLINGSTIDGRKNATKRILNINYKIPIYIRDNIILLQLKSIRNNCSMYISLNNIIDYKYKNNRLLIKCINNYIFTINISKYNFEKLIINGLKLNNVLKTKKSDNFV